MRYNQQQLADFTIKSVISETPNKIRKICGRGALNSLTIALARIRDIKLLYVDIYFYETFQRFTK